MNRIADKVLQPLHFYALISGKVLPPSQKSQRNLRHTFATLAMACPESEAYFCNLCNGLFKGDGSYFYSFFFRVPFFYIIFASR